MQQQHLALAHVVRLVHPFGFPPAKGLHGKEKLEERRAMTRRVRYD
jgi:hypothetical protein